MACNNCDDTCNDCGCLHIVPEECVSIKNDYPCLEVSKGDTLKDVLENLDAIVCDLVPPSGITYVGTADQIDVTGNVISLSNTVLTEINNLQSDVAALETCMSGTVKNITTSTSGMSIVQTSSDSCGRVLAINYTPGSVPITQKQGVIYNLTTPTTIVSGTNQSIPLSTYGLLTGDIIRIKGSLTRQPGENSEQTIVITDAAGINTNTLYSVASLFTDPTQYNIVSFTIELSVVSNTAGNITLKTFAELHSRDGSIVTVFPLNTTVSFSDSFYQQNTNLTVASATFRLVFTHTFDPILEKLTAEIIRKI